MAALYKMFFCQGGLNWIYGECTVRNVLLSRWFDLVRHGCGTVSKEQSASRTPSITLPCTYSLEYFFTVSIHSLQCIHCLLHYMLQYSNDISDAFAGFFNTKVVGIVESTGVDPEVYNGRQRIFAEDWMFMTGERIMDCIKGLKIKNTEGYDRIPQRIIIDGGMILCEPL